MANLGNTIINGILRVNGDINAGGSIKAPTLIGNLTGNASSATKLQTARKINGIAFDGTKDIVIEAGSSGHTILNSAGTTMAQRSKLKFMNSTVTDDSANDTTIITPAGITGSYLPLSGGTMTGTIVNNMITGSHLDGNKGKAVIDIINSNANYVTVLRTNALNGKFTLSSSQDTLNLCFTENKIINEGKNEISHGISFWGDGHIVPLKNNIMILGSPEQKWHSIYATGFIGNASSANILQTARVINGTSFNGSANITTANWGTARNIGIVNSDGTGTAVVTSVNGSANINLKLPSTIKATLTGNASTASTLANARTINGTSFNGSANITTANWGTARTLTIGNTGKSVNGSANITWSLAEIGAAASSHTHSYLPLSGGTLTGDLEITQGNNIVLPSLDNSTTYTLGYDNSNFLINYVNKNIKILEYDRITNKLNTTANAIKAGSFEGNLSGNASTATTATKANQLTTARTISLTGDATASGSFNGTANLALSTTIKTIDPTDNRVIKPNATTKRKLSYYFTSKGGLTTNTGNSEYLDLIILNGYGDTSGGKVNALAFAKSSTVIYHYQAAQGDTTWGTAHQLAYTTSNVSSATVLQTARTINGTSFNGSANITTANWGTARNIGIVNSDGTGTAVPVSVNGSGNVNLKLPSTIKASLSGNASTATTATKANQLTTARTIGVSGVTGTAQSFNGTANITIPITAVPASLLTGKNAIKTSELNNDKHFIPSSTDTVKNIVSMTKAQFDAGQASLASGTLVAITDEYNTYVSTQASSITCDLPLNL